MDGAERGLPDRVWLAVLLLFAAFVGVAAYIRLASMQADPDMFWHVETGRWIAAHGEIPRTDVFSWYGQARHAAWTAHEWLFGLLAYGLVAGGGYALLYAAVGALDGALFLLAYALAFVRSHRRALSLAVGALVVLGTYPGLAPRPQTITFCLVLAIALLGETGRLWWSLPLVALGANLHGGAYPILLLAVAFYALPSQPLVLAGAAGAVLLNPLGPVLLPYALGVVGPNAGAITEFRRTALLSQPLYLATLLGALVLLWGRRIKRKDALLALALFLLSLAAVRMVPFFYVLAVPILAAYVPRRRTSPEAARDEQPRLERVNALDWAPAGVLAVLIALASAAAAARPLDVTAGYPAAAAEYVKAQGLDRVWNVWQDGGFLISAGVPPMVDGRADPFMAANNRGVDMAADYFRALYLEEDPAAFLARTGVRHLIVPKGLPFYRALVRNPALTVLYEDDEYAVMRFDATRDR